MVIGNPLNRKTRWRYQSYVLDGLLLLWLCLLFFWRDLTPVLTDRLGFASGDFSDQFYAFARYEASRLLVGELPLWNPYNFAGHPFLADVQSAIFYPISLLTIFATNLNQWGTFPYRALELEALLHFPLVAVFTYLLARRLTDSRVGGLVAAIIFTFSGYLTSYPPLQLAILEVQTWLPLILLLLDVAASRLATGNRRSALRWTLAAGLVLGISTLAGHAQSSLFVIYGSVAFGLFSLLSAQSFQLNRHSVTSAVGLLALFVLTGLGIAAVQILPSFEFMLQSTRANSSFEIMGSGFTPYDLIQMVLPAVGVPFPALYAGILPLGLAAIALVRYLPHKRAADTSPTESAERNQVVFWLASGLLALLLSFGKHLSIYQIFYLFAPGWRLFRHQERAIVWVILALTILAGFGAAWMIQRRTDDKSRAARQVSQAYVWATLVALTVAAIFFISYQAGNEALWGFTAATLFLALMLALSAVAIRSRRAWLLILVIVLDLFTITPRSHAGPFVADPFPPHPLFENLDVKAEPFRVSNDQQLPDNYGIIYGIEDTGGASPLKMASYQTLLDRVPQQRVWELLNVKYVLSAQEELGEPAERVASETVGDAPLYLHQLQTPYPRAWLVNQMEVEPDENRLWQRLASDDFDPFSSVLLASLPDGYHSGINPSCNGEIRWQERQPERLTLETSTEQPCILVVSELHYPGWQATVDSASVPILKAYGVLRAIVLPAGSHVIELTYRPPSVIVGAIISLLTLVLVLILITTLFFLRRHASDAEQTLAPRLRLHFNPND